MRHTDEQFNVAAALGLPDGQLYKMAGNSVAVPVISAIGEKSRQLMTFTILQEARRSNAKQYN